MAVCLEDPDSRISDLAKLFFNELSQKGLSIYVFMLTFTSKHHLQHFARLDK
jgi:hypothetical protein